MKIHYNIPRCGNLTAQLYPNAKRLYDLFDHYGHIKRLKSTNQLGRLRDVYEGAHHTRYEYVFLQLAIVTELCINNRGDIGFTSRRNFCGQINDEIGTPSLGDLLQCLIILSNIGYMRGTLSCSRAWLSTLKNNEDVKSVFRRNLESADRAFFDKVIDSFNYYEFKYLIALFVLQRSKRFDDGSGIEIANFGTSVIRKYFEKDHDLKVETWRNLYRTIRKISFITLDSLYAPVPFNLELSSILLNFEELYETLFIKNATYNLALSSLEQALQSSVYLSSDACLTTSKATQEIYGELQSRFTHDPPSATNIKALISEDLNQNTNVSWTRERKLILTFHIDKRKTTVPEQVLNPALWENDVAYKINHSQCIAGLLVSGFGDVIKLSFGLKTTSPQENQKTALKIIRESLKFRDGLDPTLDQLNDKGNKHELIKFALKSLFGWNTRSILTDKGRSSHETLIAIGRMSFLSQIEDFLTNESESLDASEVHEIKTIRRFVDERAWAGLTVGHIGGMKLFNEGSNEEKAEFDGLVILPTINANDPFAYLIEGKNLAGGNGHTQAARQLRRRLTDELGDHLQFTIHHLPTIGAYAAISLRD